MSSLSPSDPAYRYDDPTVHGQDADEDFEHSSLPAAGTGAGAPSSPALSQGSAAARKSASRRQPSDEDSLSSGESSGIESVDDEDETDAEAKALEEDLLDADDVAAGQPTRKEWVMNALSKGGRSRGQSYRTVNDADADVTASRSTRSGGSTRRSAGSGGAGTGSSGRSSRGKGGAASSSGRSSRKGGSMYALGASSASGAPGSGSNPAQLEKGFGDDPVYGSGAAGAKKPWYKKWWLWVLIVVGVIAIAAAIAAGVVASQTNGFTSLNGTDASSSLNPLEAMLAGSTGAGASGAAGSTGAIAENIVKTYGASSLYASNAGLYSAPAPTPNAGLYTGAPSGFNNGLYSSAAVASDNGLYTPWSASTTATAALSAASAMGSLSAWASWPSAAAATFKAKSASHSLNIHSANVQPPHSGASAASQPTGFSFAAPWPTAAPTIPSPAAVAPSASSTGLPSGAYSWEANIGQATYFDSSHHTTICGLAPLDNDYVVAISASMFKIAMCDQQVVVTNLLNGLSVNAWVSEAECTARATNSSIDLSQAAFEALSPEGLSVGVLQVAWGLAPKGQTSQDGLPGTAPASSGATQSIAVAAATPTAQSWSSWSAPAEASASQWSPASHSAWVQPSAPSWQPTTTAIPGAWSQPAAAAPSQWTPSSASSGVLSAWASWPTASPSAASASVAGVASGSLSAWAVVPSASQSASASDSASSANLRMINEFADFASSGSGAAAPQETTTGWGWAPQGPNAEELDEQNNGLAQAAAIQSLEAAAQATAPVPAKN